MHLYVRRGFILNNTGREVFNEKEPFEQFPKGENGNKPYSTPNKENQQAYKEAMISKSE